MASNMITIQKLFKIDKKRPNKYLLKYVLKYIYVIIFYI